MKTTRNFDRQLRDLLYVTGVERKELAHYLGVSVPTMNRWLNGASAPNVYQFREIAQFFGVSYTWLLDGKEIDARQLAERLSLTEATVNAMLRMADSEEAAVMDSVNSAIWAVFSAAIAISAEKDG